MEKMNREVFLLRLDDNINLLDDPDNYLNRICVESLIDSKSSKDFVLKLSDKIEDDFDFVIALYFAGFLTGVKTANDL